MIIMSKTTGYKAELNNHPHGVLVKLYTRPTAPGSAYKRLGVYLSEKPFHVVLDCVHDMLRDL